MGQPLVTADPLQARQLGLAVVYQDDSLVRELTVAENLLLGAVDGPATLGGKREWAAKQLAPYDLGISPDTLVGHLSASQRQFLEIVKALAANPKVLLLDEPTSSLDISGVEKLSDIIQRIVAAGAAVVYVSHRLPEILALANRVTILRDGEGQGTYEVDDRLSENDLIALMVGRPIDTEYPAGSDVAPTEVVLSAKGLSGSRFHDVASRCSPRRDSRVCRRPRATDSARRCARWAASKRPAARCFATAGRSSRDAARRPRCRHSFAQRRSGGRIDLSRAWRAREHDRAGARAISPPAG